jgi:hypothetical protein
MIVGGEEPSIFPCGKAFGKSVKPQRLIEWIGMPRGIHQKLPRRDDVL